MLPGACSSTGSLTKHAVAEGTKGRHREAFVFHAEFLLAANGRLNSFSYYYFFNSLNVNGNAIKKHFSKHKCCTVPEQSANLKFADWSKAPRQLAAYAVKNGEEPLNLTRTHDI